MKNLKITKIITVIFFLIILYPADKISFFNGLILILSVLDAITSIFIVNEIDSEFLKILFIYSFTLISCFTFFKSNKYWIISSVLIQFLYLIFTFRTDYLNHWTYYIPSSIYLILSLFLIIKLFVVKPINTNDY
jgi:hypothetical protein